MHHHKLTGILADIAPHLFISVEREYDPYFTWDGYGPDPTLDGYEPHNVTVTARFISNGEMYQDESHLGGCYFSASEPTGDIHGYFPQMVQECVERVHDEIAMQAPNEAQDITELENALNAIHEHMKREYDAQRAEIAAQ